MSMFENYTTSTNYTDNRFKILPNIDENYETIIVGADCENNFLIPFRYSALAESMRIFYKQGIDHTILLDDDGTNVEICEDDTKSIITLKLNNEFTSKFKATNLNTVCQFEFKNSENKIFYSDEYKIKVIEPINCGEDDVNNTEVE